MQNSPVISFDLSGRAEVSITKNRGTFNASAVKVYPESLGIKPTVSGNKLTFAMNGAQKLAVSLDGTKTNMAYIMANDPVSKPKAQKTFPAQGDHPAPRWASACGTAPSGTCICIRWPCRRR